MYYPELLEVIEKTQATETVEKIDKYFAFLPNRSENIITTSNLASRLELDFSIVDLLLKYIYDLGVIDKVYIVLCPECGREILISSQRELMRKVQELDHCIKCRKDIFIDSSDVIVGYKVIKNPNIDSSDIIKETAKILAVNSTDFSDRDMLNKMFEENKENPHDFFYKPSSEEKEQLKRLYESLDDEYDSTKLQGDALEGIIALLFNCCEGMTASTILRTTTNQIDCTIRNDYFIPLTIYKELGSLFRAEGKNEPNKKPNNNYYMKLHGILSTSKFKDEQSVGIIFSRNPITSTCIDLARQFFLRDNIVIINVNDSDLERIIYDNENFLDVLQEKIQYVKGNFTTAPEKHKLYRRNNASN